MRIDKLLWYIRLAASRNFAQHWVLEGHIRLNGKRVSKPGTAVAPGDILTLPMRTEVKIITILSLPDRRGPASETRLCYQTLDERAGNPIAAS
jgi:ribosome-associated heat shock protein Hsp15